MRLVQTIGDALVAMILEARLTGAIRNGGRSKKSAPRITRQFHEICAPVGGCGIFYRVKLMEISVSRTTFILN
jgi:hypothetical protein